MIATNALPGPIAVMNVQMGYIVHSRLSVLEDKCCERNRLMLSASCNQRKQSIKTNLPDHCTEASRMNLADVPHRSIAEMASLVCREEP